VNGDTDVELPSIINRDIKTWNPIFLDKVNEVGHHLLVMQPKRIDELVF
jgi:hypothetical protein